jgi:outer membrane protein insertion porin family
MPPASALAVLLPLVPLQAPQPPAQPPLVERIEIANNQFLQRETLLFYVSSKPGEPYDERKLREDFRRLWDTGFLDDLRIEAVDGPQGKVVTFFVTERRRIQIVDYRGSKELTQSTIEDELKKRDAQVKMDTFYDPTKARKVEAIIKEMLAAKGYPFGSVKHEAKNIGASGQQLSFVIDQGPKAKVHEIVFDGNEVFSDDKLRGRMKKVKQPGFFNLSWLGGKTTYTEDKWLGGQEDPRGDRGRIEDFYLDNGYVTARVGQPRISYTDGKSGFFKKKPIKLMKLEIPVTEGAQYKMGALKFEGLTVLKEDFVRAFFKMREGDVYNDSRFKKAYEKLRDVYGSLGYFQWTGGTERKPDAERKVVDVTVRMEEDKQYFLGRLSFIGNDSTRDKVIRREIYMNEGDVFNTEALKMSIKRVNQLGYFKQMESAPDIQPNPDADNKVDVTFKVEEQNRNQFTFGGGVSGYEGTFINASFSTTNFLGAGETVSLAVQTGSRTKNYAFSISEPYFLDRPITAGLNVFLNRITYLSYGTTVGYGQQTQGIGVTTGLAVGRFSRLFMSYSYQIIDIYDVDRDALDSLQRATLTSGSSLPIIDPSYLDDTGRRRESGVSPSFVRNTVDNPYQPRSGSRHTASVQLIGGPFQGTVNYVRPTLESVLYIPVRRRMALGVRGQIGLVQPFGDTAETPYYQRYFLGGETQIRGYNVRSVAPYDPATRTSLGGDKFVLLNAEYYFDLLGPLRLLLFFDAGQAYAPGQSFYWRTMSTSTGIEARFTMPVLNVPFRLIYAWNPNRDFYQPATAFKFAVGTTF